ncbi:hypothetical protein GGP42_001170 [Salinibacter ruber]|nr:hypothetical protein [Salinibacter ruber]MCS4039520.1 hypothetical protein [Salinibacter ruber]
MAEGIHDAEFDHLVRQKAQTPLRAALWGLRAGQADQLHLFFSIKLAVVFPVRTFALDRSLKATLTKAPPNSSNAPFGKLEGFPDALIRPGRPLWTFVGLQQDPSAPLFTDSMLSTANPFEETAPLLLRKLDTVCFLCHEIEALISRLGTGMYEREPKQSRVTQH